MSYLWQGSGRIKTKFRYGSAIHVKDKHRSFRRTNWKVRQKPFYMHGCPNVQYEVKRKKNSSHHRSEVFYLLGLNQLVFTLTQQHSQGKL